MLFRTEPKGYFLFMLTVKALNIIIMPYFNLNYIIGVKWPITVPIIVEKLLMGIIYSDYKQGVEFSFWTHFLTVKFFALIVG